MDINNLKKPPTHYYLRAFLEMTKRAVELKDKVMLDGLVKTFDLLDEDQDDLRAYIYGSYELLRDECGGAYLQYEKEDIDRAESELHKVAYGDFDEAMSCLERDLSNIVCLCDSDSGVFDTKYFNDEQKEIWKKLRQPVIDKDEVAASRAYDEVRKYQQRAYGDLIPVLFANYEKGQKGGSVRLVVVDGEIKITGLKELVVGLQEIVKTSEVMSEDILPKSVNGYKLGTVSSFDLFRYEL